MPSNVRGARGEGVHRPNYPGLVTKRFTFSFNSPNIDTGVLWFRFPKRGMITQCAGNVETVFNAGTTNVVVVGHGASLNEIIAAADLDESSASFQALAGPLSLEFTEEKDFYVKYTQSGTAATAGKATLLLSYVPWELVK